MLFIDIVRGRPSDQSSATGLLEIAVGRRGRGAGGHYQEGASRGEPAWCAGPTATHAARVIVGHGGQILVAESTAALLSGVDLLDLGPHQLRDLPRPERVVQLCHPDLRHDFPPLRTASAVVYP